MTYETPANEELHPMKFLRKQKKSTRLLLAAVSIFITSLGVTAARSTNETRAADNGTVLDSNLKLAETKTNNVPTSNQVKTQTQTQTNHDKHNTMTKPKIGPDPSVMLNPQPLPPQK